MEQTKISISLTMDEAIHEHTATFNYNEDEDVDAYDAIKHFLYLCQNVYGEMATEEAMERVKKEW